MDSLWLYILPEHVWKAADTSAWRSFRPPLPLVGSGPYTVKRWNPNGTTVLERNPFFARRRGVAGPARVLMTYYADPRKAVADLERNRLDVMPNGTLDVAGAQRLQRAANVRVYSSPPLGLEYWVFNLSPTVASRVHQRVVQSRAVRTALAWAIDRPSSCRPPCSATARPATRRSRAATGNFSLDLSQDPQLGYHYDPARARRILDAGGMEARARRRAASRAARARSSSSPMPASPSEQRAATLIRGWARDVGIEIDLRVYDRRRSPRPRVPQERGASRAPSFDTELWSIGGDPSPEFLLSLFTQKQLGAWNDSGFVNKTYDKLYRQEVRAAGDLPARISAIHHAPAHRDDVPALHRAVRGGRHRRRQHAHLVALDDAAGAAGASRSPRTATTP